MIGSAGMPIQSPNFVPFLLRAKEAKPEIVFGFHPGGVQASSFMKAYAEAGLREAGIQLIGPGDLTMEEELPNMAGAADGVITADQYTTWTFFGLTEPRSGSDPASLRSTLTSDGHGALCLEGAECYVSNALRAQIGSSSPVPDRVRSGSGPFSWEHRHQASASRRSRLSVYGPRSSVP